VHVLANLTAAARRLPVPSSCCSTGVLHYQDTSTGQIVAQHRTRLGACAAMRQNPYNGVLCCGHNNGTVTMWTPNITTPVVKMLCHRGAITALAVDPTGHQLVTAGGCVCVGARGTAC
jgi:U3 small nucleolar RNA-associated protein 7